MVEVTPIRPEGILETESFPTEFIKKVVLPLFQRFVSEIKNLDIKGVGNEITLDTSFKQWGGNIRVLAIFGNKNGAIVVKMYDVDAVWPYKGRTEKTLRQLKKCRSGCDFGEIFGKKSRRFGS